MQGFLTRDPHHRLGCKDGVGVKEIHDHPFFASIDWGKLAAREMQPPYVPDVTGKVSGGVGALICSAAQYIYSSCCCHMSLQADTGYFEQRYVVEEPILTVMDDAEIAKIDQTEFEGFSYIDLAFLNK